MSLPDLSRIKSVYVIGIGGSGMGPIAKILHEMGFRVMGSDLKESTNTIRLRDMGIEVFLGHHRSHLRTADLLVHSTAVSPDNVEMLEARSRDIPILRRAEILAWIMSRSHKQIAVAGTHGKTTTTSMISLLFEQGDLHPTFLIGADHSHILLNAKTGNGQYIVAEADESDGSFLKLPVTHAVVTNIEDDHLDFYGSYDKVVEAFRQFLQNLPVGGKLFACIDDPGVAKVIDSLPTHASLITYGLHMDAMYRAKETRFDKMLTITRIGGPDGKEIGEMTLQVPGRQNVLNGLAAVAVALDAGMDFMTIRGILSNFTGARRRFQVVGEVDDIMIVDDYAHHPTEIKATLAAARNGWGKGHRLICIFQPHRYSRTFLLKEAFGKCFDDADMVCLTEIYAAGEAPIAGVSGQMLQQFINTNGHPKAHFFAKKEEIPRDLLQTLKAGDIVLTLGAGDVHTVGKEIYNRLREKKLHDAAPNA